MVNISAEIDEATVREITSFLDGIASKTPQHLAKATKVTGLEICKNLKARTKKSPKRIRPSEYIANTHLSPLTTYITYRRGKKLDVPLHRWRLTRKKGTPAESTHFYFVYSHTKESWRRRMGMRNGNYQGIVTRKIVPDLAAEKKELLQYHGGIQHAGLAKQSWGWAAKGIFNGTTEDVSYKRRKHDRRDPRKNVSGESKTWVTGKNSGTTEVSIENKIDYICDAMYPGAVDDAAKAALRSMLYKVNNGWLDRKFASMQR